MISANDFNKKKKDSLTVTYEEYGAVGDGVTDDSEAIRAAHNAANESGANVLGRTGSRYLIGPLARSIEIKTNTDWNGAEIIFDDSSIHWQSPLRGINVFNVSPSVSPLNIDVPDGLSLKKGQTNIGIMLDKPYMLKIEDESDKIYKRYGENANGGVAKNEMILVDELGNVDPSTPIQYDYSKITKITAYSISEEPITVSNALIKTLAPNPKTTDPDYENNYCYFARGILVTRANTTLKKITHRVYGEDMTIEIDRNGDGVIDKWGADKSYGVPYVGFYCFRNCYNVAMTDCRVQGHQAYSFYQGATREEKGNIRNEMGSYDINASDCVNISFNNIVQYENKETGEVITNRFMYHGVMGSNFCRNVVMQNCYLDRFDSHQGVHNATIRNCTLGFGILVIGGGELYIEDVYRIGGGAFIMLRYDYNGVFDGDVTIKNCRAGEDIDRVFTGMWVEHYNGLKNQVTNSLIVDGFTVDGGKLDIYDIRCATCDSLTNSVNKLFLPRSVRVSRVVGRDASTPVTLKLCRQEGLFDEVDYSVN